MDLQKLVRKNIRRLTPYSSARKEFAGTARIFLDANENSYGSPLGENYHRYPDPLQTELKKEVAGLSGVRPGQIFVGNGSDEAIDLLLRVFCEPDRDNIVITPPTYGMYQISAAINDVRVKRAPLTENFELDSEAIGRTLDRRTKMIFVCSPNNPTGNSLDRGTILRLAETFPGLVVVDEAYIDFSSRPSLVVEIGRFPNLVVLQTFSKAWGLAGLRVGLAFADPEVIDLLNRIKPPYNVSEIAQRAVLRALKNKRTMRRRVAAIIAGREKLRRELAQLEIIRRIYPTDANFVLAKTVDAGRIYRFLLDHGIVVRNRHNVAMCAGCLRFTVGTPDENKSLIRALKRYERRDGKGAAGRG